MNPYSFTPETILMAYCNGYFPMGKERSKHIEWYRPDPRAVFDLNDFHIPRSLKKLLDKKDYDVRFDQNFDVVMTHCQKRREGTWITDEFIQQYKAIHHLGYAHSLEVYQNNCLIGGLYGLSIGGAFFGESMFHIKSNYSKVALCELVFHMKKNGMTLLDAQFYNEHLKQFNLKLIPDSLYIQKLHDALQQQIEFNPVMKV